MLRQAMPQLLSEKRHEWMQQQQRRFEYGEKIAPCRHRDSAIRIRHSRLHPLDIPIAEIAPEEVIDDMRGFVKTEILQRVIDRGYGLGKPRENPAVREADSIARGIGRRSAHLW